MSYQVGNLPADAPAWIVSEFRKLQESQNSAIDGLIFRTLYAAPSRISEGLTVKADGTTWDPGSGGGIYCYRAGAWRFLG